MRLPCISRRCCLIPHVGGLTGIGALNAPLPERTRKIHLDAREVRWSARGALSYNPHIGTLSISPDRPLRTPSAERIIARALTSSDRPLYVCGIGCVTNIASAL